MSFKDFAKKEAAARREVQALKKADTKHESGSVAVHSAARPEKMPDKTAAASKP
jgi:hypothetical protein